MVTEKDQTTNGYVETASEQTTISPQECVGKGTIYPVAKVAIPARTTNGTTPWGGTGT